MVSKHKKQTTLVEKYEQISVNTSVRACHENLEHATKNISIMIGNKPLECGHA